MTDVATLDRVLRSHIQAELDTLDYRKKTLLDLLAELNGPVVEPQSSGVVKKRRVRVSDASFRDACKALGSFTVYEMAEHLGCSSKTVINRLPAALDRGTIVALPDERDHTCIPPRPLPRRYEYVDPRTANGPTSRPKQPPVEMVLATAKPQRPKQVKQNGKVPHISDDLLRAWVRKAKKQGANVTLDGNGHVRVEMDGKIATMPATPGKRCTEVTKIKLRNIGVDLP